MGLFSIFSKKKKIPRLDSPVDLSLLKCDLHSHFIPGIDDGAKTMEDSIELITCIREFGYQKVITTPHVMSDYYRNSSETILEGKEKVAAALLEKKINIQIEASAEYYLDYDFDEKIKKKDLLPIGDKKYILFELSFMTPPDNLHTVIFTLISEGYQPVLAHPERYNYWHSDFEQYEKVIEKGALLQLNINSLTGNYSMETKAIAEQMIEKNMISFLGTDCHHMGHIQLMKEVVYEPYLKRLIESGKLLNSNLM